jgi:hypothetical protein
MKITNMKDSRNCSLKIILRLKIMRNKRYRNKTRFKNRSSLRLWRSKFKKMNKMIIRMSNNKKRKKLKS